MELGSCTQNGHGLSLCGRHIKNKALQEGKKKGKKIHLPLIYIIQSAILNQSLFILERKITKTVNKKDNQVTASLYTQKFTNLSIVGFCQKQLHCP